MQEKYDLIDSKTGTSLFPFHATSRTTALQLMSKIILVNLGYWIEDGLTTIRLVALADKPETTLAVVNLQTLITAYNK